MECSELVQKLYQELCSSTQNENNELKSQLTIPYLQAYALYIAKCYEARNTTLTNREAPRNGGLTLTQIINSLNINIFDFMKRLSMVVEILAPKFPELFGTDNEAEWVLKLDQWRRLFVYSIVLSQKYKDLFKTLFTVNFEPLIEKKLFRFGWLLFLVEKSRILPYFPDLESCFHLLLCVCNFLMMHTSEALWKFGFQSLLNFHNLTTDTDFSILKKLAIMSNIHGVEEHKKLENYMTIIESSTINLLNSRQNLPDVGLPLKRESASCHFKELFLDPERHLLDDYCKTLDSTYNEYLVTEGEFDERFFLKPLSQDIPSPTILNTSTQPNSKIPVSFTKVLNSVDNISLGEWISHFCETLAIQPSEEVQACLELNEKTVLVNLDSSLHSYARKIFRSSSFRGGATSSLSKEAFYGIKLFYLGLDRVLSKVSDRKVKLLRSKSFIQSLMACAFEIVTLTLNLENMLFPILLNLLQLKAFDLSKILELFIQSFPELPQSIKNHFQVMEQQIIESLAWVAGSSLYPLITHISLVQPILKNTDELNTTESLFPKIETPIPGLSLDKRSPSSAFKIVPTSRSDKRKSFNDNISPMDPIPDALGPIEELSKTYSLAKTVVEEFFRKELKLMALHLMEFRSSLGFDPLSPGSVMIQVYKTMKYALYEQTSLFYNRHLDQLLMCSLYGVCKVNVLSITFRHIIAQYKNQARSQPDIYRSVIVKQSNPAFTVEKKSDIIEFYNTVFLPRMQAFLLSCSNSAKACTDSKQLLDLDEQPLACRNVCPWLCLDSEQTQ